jgi:hypothetical protein
LSPEDKEKKDRQDALAPRLSSRAGIVAQLMDLPQSHEDDPEIIREGIVQDVGALPEGLPEGTPALQAGDKVFYLDGEGYKIKDVRVIPFHRVLAIEPIE